jgi:hypothetical protein
MTWTKLSHAKDTSIYLIDFGSTIFNFVYIKGLGLQSASFDVKIPDYEYPRTDNDISSFPNKKLLIKALFISTSQSL